MLPLLRWPGGKARKAKVLAAIMPPHTTYCEPFAGGLSVLLNKAPANVEVAGDVNRWLAPFYDAARKGALDRCKPTRLTRANFERVRTKAREGRATACELLFLNKSSFHGDMRDPERVPDGKPVATTALQNLPRYRRRLRRVHLRIADFEDTMRRWDSPTTLHFLDPPWVARRRSRGYSEKRYTAKGRGEDVPVERVAEVAAEMEGRVVVSYDDSPRARRAFNRAGLHVYKMPTTRTSGSKGTVKTTELCVTNFRLPPKIRVGGRKR